jgi:hypothetical protein
LWPQLHSHSDCVRSHSDYVRLAPACRRWAGCLRPKGIRNSEFIHSAVLLLRLGHVTLRDHHERTNRIAIHFSPKAILACGRSCSHSRAHDRAVDVGRARSTKRSGPCCRAACSEGRREEEEKEEKRRCSPCGKQPARTTETAIVLSASAMKSPGQIG